MLMDINGLIKYCFSLLPDEIKQKPWSILGHGRDVLSSEEQLNAYIAAYGEMHIIKCRAALQNFPFDTLTNFEVIDWGCGQGIASLVLIDMLKERNRFYGLRRITLVEPSEIALNRAERILQRFAQTNIEIRKINTKIPSDSQGCDFPHFRATSNCTINLFSNILDLPFINLQWLANEVVKLGNIQHIVCIGPKFCRNSRIDDFCGYFKPNEYFSKISEHRFGYTSNTHYSFGCETACFTNQKSEVDNSYTEKSIFDGKDNTYADFDYLSESLRGFIDDTILDAYNVLRSKFDNNADIFIQPHISTDIPDIVIVKQNCGIVLFDICTSTNAEDFINEFDRINTYANNLINLHLQTMKVRTIVDRRSVGLIKKAIYFSNITSEQLEKKLNDYFDKKNQDENQDEKSKVDPKTEIKKLKQYISIICTSTELQCQELMERLGCQYDNSQFDKSLYDDIINVIVSKGWHSYKDGDTNLKLTKKQQTLSRSNAIKQKIKGAAGSGKTQVLACRAVNSLVRTGGRILILTFNITLVNYIKYRMSQVPADFSWNMIDITNYHQFFKSQATEVLRAKLKIGDWENVSYFESCRDKTFRYDAVFVDESQDYKNEWYRIITKYFLKEKGEFVVFGDGMQNIYNRELDEEHQPQIAMIPGRWNEIKEDKNISFRIENSQLIQLASSFQKQFLEFYEPLIIQNSLGEFYLKYWKIKDDATADTVCSNIMWILQQYNLDIKSTVVLSQTIKILRDVEYCFKSNATTSFETKDEFDRIVNNNFGFKRKINLDSIRRVKKLHFTTDTPYLKMSTIHSFKGWESDNVILILLREGEINDEEDNYDITRLENSPALVYTAITRARKNLFILNKGNDKYHEFLKNNIK